MRKPLGRGLDALIPGRPAAVPAAPPPAAVVPVEPPTGRLLVAVGEIAPNPEQPRLEYNDCRLQGTMPAQ